MLGMPSFAEIFSANQTHCLREKKRKGKSNSKEMGLFKQKGPSLWDASQVLAGLPQKLFAKLVKFSLLPAPVTSKLESCFVVLISLGHQNFRMFFP